MAHRGRERTSSKMLRGHRGGPRRTRNPTRRLAGNLRPSYRLFEKGRAVNDDRLLEQWLRRLGWALGRLSAHERDDIVAETRGHLEERIAAGAPLATVLAEFGPADRYARQFIEEMEAYGALGSQQAGALARIVIGRAHRSLAAAITFLAMLVLGVVAAIDVFLIALKLFDPVHTGVWVGPDFTLIGVIGDPREGQELLGLWLFPAAALVLLVAWILGRLLLSLTVPRLMGHHSFPNTI